MTDVEQILWKSLRQRQILNCKFRRQAPIGKYIVDFVCFEKKLIIELDGGQHNTGKQKDEDRCRDAWLIGQGFRVMRFWNHDVLKNLEGTVDQIWKSL